MFEGTQETELIGSATMAVRGFKDLMVWEKSMDLVEQIYRLTSNFPKHETYGLSSQLQRAGVSIVANIAEGNGRDSTREFIHHLGQVGEER